MFYIDKDKITQLSVFEADLYNIPVEWLLIPVNYNLFTPIRVRVTGDLSRTYDYMLNNSPVLSSIRYEDRFIKLNLSDLIFCIKTPEYIQVNYLHNQLSNLLLDLKLPEHIKPEFDGCLEKCKEYLQ